MKRQDSFLIFLNQKKNRQFSLIALIITVVQFIVFKNLYPYADFFSDSYSYIYAAQANLDINIWPIGYSKFLRIFHHFSNSDTSLIAFQYFFLEVSSIYLFFTITYFYRPSHKVTIGLYIFLFINPLFLYICNYVNSDPLFIAISLLWITQLLWIIEKPQIIQIFSQAFLLLACFTIRNNAYYYPIITALAFYLSQQKTIRKIAGTGLGILLIAAFIIFERNAAEKLTGTKQFSLFTGWMLANNALYMYGHIVVDSSKFHSAEARELNRMSNKYFNKAEANFDKYLTEYVANFFIRQPEAPLKRYFSNHYSVYNELDGVIAWGKASIIFEDFGRTLIKQHPISFIEHFMIRNTRNYFIPPLEKLELYNTGSMQVDGIAQDWFDYKSQKISVVSPTIQATILFLYPFIFMLLNVYSIGGVTWFYYKGNYKPNVNKLSNALLLIMVLSLFNAGFCIFATIIVLRYQVFPMIMFFLISLLLTDWMDREELNKISINENTKYNIDSQLV